MESKKTPTRLRWYLTTVFVCAVMAAVLFGISLITIAEEPQEAPYKEGEIMIQLPVDAKVASVAAAFPDVNMRSGKLLSKRMNIWLFEYDHTGMKADQHRQLLSNVRQHGSVNLAQFNHQVTMRANYPNDEDFDLQWALHNYNQAGCTNDADVDAPEAWDSTTGGTTALGDEIVVAVIDGGFDINHHDLSFWKNIHEIPGNGIDDDTNGYIDDYDGWNAHNHNGVITVDAHGTHVAGIAGAVGNNGIDISGVNWGARVLPVCIATTYESEVVEAYAYVHEIRCTYNETGGAQGAYVVSTNSSFGINYGDPDDYPIWCAMYDSLGDAGMLSAGATANLNIDVDVYGDIPTACPSDYLISVTNTTCLDVKYAGAAYGLTTIDLGAPGTNIWSTVPYDACDYGTGTSMAAPHVAGAVALLYAAAPSSLIQQAQTDPGGVALMMKQFIMDGTDPLTSLDGKTVSGGRLNVFNSISEICVPPVTAFSGNPLAGYAPLTVNFSDESTGDVTDWAWDFGDGDSAFVENPSHEYDVGTYTVSLKVTGDCGSDSLTKTNYVTVSAPPLPPAPVLVSPADHANLYDFWTPYTLDWAETQYAETYRVELSKYSNFSTLYDYADSLTETQWDTPPISVGIDEIDFYWRVRASNASGDGPWSVTRHFCVYRSKAYLVEPVNDVTNQDSIQMSWYGVEGAFAYEVYIDNSPLFTSPEKDTVIWDSTCNYCHDYITPPLPSNTRYYWKVKSFTSYFYSTSVVKSFFLESGGGGASCPVLFSYDGNDFVRENPLLTACEQSNYTEVVTDYYHLTGPIAPRGNSYAFQLRETENEMTYLRDIELITVDHSTESMVGCAVDGRIFTYSESVTPLSAVDNTGVGRLDALVATDDNLFVATGPGHLVLTFPNPSGDAYVDFTAPGKSPCPFEDPGPPPPKTVADGDRPSAPLKIEIMDEHGEWVEMPDIPSRENPTQEFVLSSMELPAEIDFITVRISWEDGFSADVVRQYVPADETPEIKTWTVSSGNLFTADPLPKAWPGFDNGAVLELVKGDILEFEFSVDQPVPSGQARDFIIRAVGRYQPDYSVFTHLVPGQFQLYDNHPNPFNIQTKIAYDLPAATHVKLEIFNMLGRHVATLVDEQQSSGHYQVEWNGQDTNGRIVSSGLYVYRLTAPGFDESKKMMLLK